MSKAKSKNKVVPFKAAKTKAPVVVYVYETKCLVAEQMVIGHYTASGIDAVSKRLKADHGSKAVIQGIVILCVLDGAL